MIKNPLACGVSLACAKKTPSPAPFPWVRLTFAGQRTPRTRSFACGRSFCLEEFVGSLELLFFFVPWRTLRLLPLNNFVKTITSLLTNAAKSWRMNGENPFMFNEHRESFVLTLKMEWPHTIRTDHPGKRKLDWSWRQWEVPWEFLPLWNKNKKKLLNWSKIDALQRKVTFENLPFFAIHTSLAPDSLQFESSSSPHRTLYLQLRLSPPNPSSFLRRTPILRPT